ncbi:MAG: type II toxin-antitoxin system HicA family toxin [Cyanobium sp. MAG06]|nr:type II toxin-antitoxin system HicA family toxin [Cyanobium sp. MAG06]
MPNKFKIYNAKILIKKLIKIGFEIESQKGSHIKLQYNKKSIIIPNHNELAIGTLQSIYKMCIYVYPDNNIINDIFLN